jgi:hypothetical protein
MFLANSLLLFSLLIVVWVTFKSEIFDENTAYGEVSTIVAVRILRFLIVCDAAGVEEVVNRFLRLDCQALND